MRRASSTVPFAAAAAPMTLAALFSLPSLPVLFATAILAIPAHAQNLQDAQDAATPRCATSIVAQRQQQQRTATFTARVQAASVAGRTLTTTHFALHYTLAPTVHRVLLDTAAADLSLKASVDSILGALPGSQSAYQRDSSLHAALDSIDAAHPLFVQRAAQYFERAWTYYDSLGMRMPDSSRSLVYTSPVENRFSVDIADMGTADNALSGSPYYGLAYPPAGASQASVILLENDFLYNASYSAGTDQVTGPAVTANIAGFVRNYNVAWDMGVKVTASHEFYHGVQYEYTPSLPSPLHAWYELSATGMEERLAPEVNDYLAYLPSALAIHRQTGLLTPVGSTANYGNSIFHTFLTRVLGEGFDVAIWEYLGDHPSDLPAALIQGVGSQVRWDSLYAAYAASMAVSGSSGAATSPLAFSPDMPQWPKPRFDSVPPTGTLLHIMLPLTYRVVRPPAAAAGLAKLTNLAGGWRVDSSSAGLQGVYVAGMSIPVGINSAGSASTLALANTSFSQAAQIQLTAGNAGLTAAQNPVRRTESQLLFFPPVGGSSDSLQVVSESGRHIATLVADTSGGYWSWNLRDAQNIAVPPGLYFFRTPVLTARPLLILP